MTLALVLVAGRALADVPPCNAPPEDCAKQAFEAGVTAFQAEDVAAALELFRTAQALRPHPVVLFNLAQAEVASGLVLEGIAHLDEVYDDPKTPESLLGRVRRERSEAQAKLAVIVADDPRATLVVDGQRASGDPPEARVNPGEHQVRVEVAGSPPIHRTVTLQVGERIRIAVTATRPAAPLVPPPTPTLADTREGLSPRWCFLAGGVTVVLGGATLVSGLDTRRAHERLKDDAPRLTPAEADARADAGERKQFRTNVLLGATGVAAAATVALGLSASWDRRVSAQIGPGSVQLSARFR